MSGLLVQQVPEGVEAALKGTGDRNEELGSGGHGIKRSRCHRRTGVGNSGEGSEEQNLFRKSEVSKR